MRELERLLDSYFNGEVDKEIILSRLERIKRGYDQADTAIKKKMEKDISTQLMETENYSFFFFMHSFLFYLTKNSTWIEEIFELLERLSNEDMEWKRRYQIFGQLIFVLHTNYQLRTEKNREMTARIYKKIVDDMKRDIGLSYAEIPVEERDKGLVIVATNQFLAIGHGPTKTALDRCSTLIRKKNKQVLLINTAEHLVVDQKTPWYRVKIGTYIAEYQELEMIGYEDVKIPFLQCPDNMPDVETMKEVVKGIQDLKPLYIVNIGGGGLLMELCSEFVPTITISTVPSDLSVTTGQLQAIGRQLKPADLPILNALGKDKSSVIESRFTWSLPVEKETISRSVLHVQEDDFVCAVVGARLDNEVGDDFVEMLLRVSASNEKIKFVFIGLFDNGYKKYSEKYEGFRKSTVYIGFVENMLGYLEQCDLYVNPIRAGGGTSVIEAMHEGLPAVTTAFGDVGIGAGEAFWVNDYKAMAEEIEHYYKDKEYYMKKSGMAKQHAEEMLDTDKAFCELLAEAEKRLGL